jgi:hypothetical protein
MPLSKSDFAALVREMPDASDDEILAEAKRRDSGSSSAGPSKSLWERANEPLTDAPSKAAAKLADAIDQPSLERSPLKAKLQGFVAGATKGAGDVVSSLTSPLNLGLTALGLGGEAAGAKGLLGVSKAARAAEAALQAPLVVEGGKNVVQGVKEGDLGKAGAGLVEAAGGAAGVRGAFKRSVSPASRLSEPGAASLHPLQGVAPVAEVALTAEASKPASGLHVAEESDPTKAASSESEIQEVSPSKPAYQLSDAASIVADLTRRNDGASFNLHKGDLVGTPHYAVSVFPDRGEIVRGHASPEEISAFVQKNQDLLQDPKNSIGTWFNHGDGKTYLDVSATTPDLNEAIALGKQHKQLAIFDLAKLQEIDLRHPSPAHVPVGEEPEYQAPVFANPLDEVFKRISEQGGRKLTVQDVAALRRQGFTLQDINKRLRRAAQ